MAKTKIKNKKSKTKNQKKTKQQKIHDHVIRLRFLRFSR